jgi:hypothetical protein
MGIVLLGDWLKDVENSINCRSPAPDGVDDLDAISGGKSMGVEPASRDQLLVHLDGEALTGELQVLDEPGHVDVLRDFGGITVDDDLHDDSKHLATRPERDDEDQNFTPILRATGTLLKSTHMRV